MLLSGFIVFVLSIDCHIINFTRRSEEKEKNLSLIHKAMLTMAGILLILLFFMIIYNDNGLIDFYNLTKRYEMMVKKNNSLKNENNELFRKVARLQSDDKLIGTIARDKYGMIEVNEIIYQIR